MSWSLRNEQGIQLSQVVSFRMEQSKGKPATLTWELPTGKASPSTAVSLWRAGECIFKGRVYERPTHIQDGLSSWTAVAIDDTFQNQRATLISELNKDLKLFANIKDCEGATAGYLHIDRVTHGVSWVPLNAPQTIWDTKGLHERDSLYIAPIEQTLKGVSASVKLQSNRMESGMMDVGLHITSRLFHDIETYSGAALEDQWSKLAYKASNAGYEVQIAELLPTSYHRANLPKSLTFLDKNDQLVSIPYHAYAVKLLLGWAMPITTYTTVTVATEILDESIGLTVKDIASANEPEVIQELIQWMNAYALNRSFTTQVKCKLLVTEAISIVHLGTHNWCKVLDSRIHPHPMQGPIVSYVVTNEGGVTWVDVTFMWAPEKGFSIGRNTTLKASTGDHVQPPQTPDHIVAWVKVMRDADDQHQYYEHNKTLPFEAFAADFPMTQLEIGLHPVLSESSEYIEKQYQIT